MSLPHILPHLNCVLLHYLVVSSCSYDLSQLLAATSCNY